MSVSGMVLSPTEGPCDCAPAGQCLAWADEAWSGPFGHPWSAVFAGLDRVRGEQWQPETTTRLVAVALRSSVGPPPEATAAERRAECIDAALSRARSRFSAASAEIVRDPTQWFLAEEEDRATDYLNAFLLVDRGSGRVLSVH